MDKRFTAFISYSWDGPSHEQWIRDLVNDLRTQGGVGFETILSLPALRTEPDKFIFVMSEGDYTTVFPYHLRDYYKSKGYYSLLIHNSEKLVLMSEDYVNDSNRSLWEKAIV